VPSPRANKPKYEFTIFAAHFSTGRRLCDGQRVTPYQECPSCQRFRSFQFIDDDAVRAATNNLANSFGHTVQTFASAEEFLRSAHLNDTSCVTADVQMPAMSGVELLNAYPQPGLPCAVHFHHGLPR
jgi:hypothetical protein